MNGFNWQVLGDPAPESLEDARLQLHYAAQVAAAAGLTFLEPAPDGSQSCLRWSDPLAALHGWSIPARPSFQLALRPSDFELVLVGEEGSLHSSFPLHQRTLEEGYGWIVSAIESFTGQPLDQKISKLGHEMPVHTVGDGKVFAFQPSESFAELARWYHNANGLLQEVRQTEPRGSLVRCWPHHFDIAILIALDPDGDPESSRSVGIGMVPGDAGYRQPYFYLTPWPYPPDPVLPPLEGGGSWHTEEWLGAILPASELVRQPSADSQVRQARAFIDSALRACLDLVG